MKLKKIASLMLAGIMAVSMLAACGSTGTETDPTEPETPATGVSAQFASYLLDKDAVAFSDNAENQNVLAKAVTKVEDSDIKSFVKSNTGVVKAGEADDALAEVMKNVMYAGWTNTLTKDVVTNITRKNTYIGFYVAPGAMNQNDVLKQVAGQLDNNLNSDVLVEDNYDDEVVGDVYYTYDYTGSVSIDKVETKDGAASVYFVLVSVTVDATPVELSK